MDYTDIIYYMSLLVKEWGQDGENVVAECFKADTKEMTCDEFLKNCSACGGNWGGMLLTGVKRLYPEVWEVIPEDMGHNAWNCIVATLKLLKIDF
jgi:hypothetical protein